MCKQRLSKIEIKTKMTVKCIFFKNKLKLWVKVSVHNVQFKRQKKTKSLSFEFVTLK